MVKSETVSLASVDFTIVMFTYWPIVFSNFSNWEILSKLIKWFMKWILNKRSKNYSCCPIGKFHHCLSHIEYLKWKWYYISLQSWSCTENLWCLNLVLCLTLFTWYNFIFMKNSWQTLLRYHIHLFFCYTRKFEHH